MKQLLLDSTGRTRPEADFEILLRKAAHENLPNIFLYCGENDFLSLPHNTALENICSRLHCPVSLCLEPGEHDVVYWRRAFREAVHAIFENAVEAI